MTRTDLSAWRSSNEKELRKRGHVLWLREQGGPAAEVRGGVTPCVKKSEEPRVETELSSVKRKKE